MNADPRLLILAAVGVVLFAAAWVLNRTMERRRLTLAGGQPVAELEQRTPNRNVLTPPQRLLPPPSLDWRGMEHVRVGEVVAGERIGEPFTLSVLGAHILIAGETGAGKSSWIWSLLDGLGPYIKCGLCEVWAIDPKGGMELTIGSNLFERYRYGSWDAMAELLEAAVKRMQERQQRLAGVARKHYPTTTEPLIVVLIDEMTVLTEIKDTKVRGRISAALFTLLAQGRAAAVTVVGAGQDIRKERLPDRHMFTTKVLLKMERLQIDMLLGEGARAAGALCDMIPKGMPGTGYVWIDGASPVEVRSFYNDDDEVRRLAQVWGRAA